jgi:hypothetical protein
VSDGINKGVNETRDVQWGGGVLVVEGVGMERYREHRCVFRSIHMWGYWRNGPGNSRDPRFRPSV